MNEKCILDTNKYVSVAMGKTNLENIKAQFPQIYLNEYNILEVVAKTYPDTLGFQQNIARLFAHTEGLVPTLPNHLRDIWGIQPNPDEEDSLRRIAIDFANANTYEEIEDLVLHCRDERDKAYKYFVENTTTDIATWKNKFTVIRRNLPQELKSKSKKENFRQQIFEPENLESHLLRTRTNAYQSIGMDEPDISQERKLESARERLVPFIKFYAQYLATCIETQPSFNDRADVCLAHYLGDGFALITGEVKILNIAKNVGLENSILNIQ